jgi:hypothetical protein
MAVTILIIVLINVKHKRSTVCIHNSCLSQI